VDGIFDEGMRIGALSDGAGTAKLCLDGERARGNESTLEAANAAVLVHKHRLSLLQLIGIISTIASSHPCRVEGHTCIAIEIIRGTNVLTMPRLLIAGKIRAKLGQIRANLGQI
jgi:hypothetical protein